MYVQWEILTCDKYPFFVGRGAGNQSHYGNNKKFNVILTSGSPEQRGAQGRQETSGRLLDILIH